MDDHTVVGRVMEILLTVRARDGMTLAELTAATGIPKTSVRRIADDLTRRGVLRHDELGYRIGPVISSLGDDSSGLESDRAAALISDLRARTGGVAWYVARADRLARQPTAVACAPELRIQVASTWPDPHRLESIATTAVGHAVLAARPEFLPRIRAARAHARPDIQREIDLLTEKLGRGIDRGAFIDAGAYTTGWRCVVSRIADERSGAAAGGLVGVCVPESGPHLRELVSAVRHTARRALTSRG